MRAGEHVGNSRHRTLSHLESFMWSCKEALIHQLVTIGGIAFQAAATGAATAVWAAAGSLMICTAAAAAATADGAGA